MVGPHRGKILSPTLCKKDITPLLNSNTTDDRGENRLDNQCVVDEIVPVYSFQHFMSGGEHRHTEVLSSTLSNQEVLSLLNRNTTNDIRETSRD